MITIKRCYSWFNVYVGNVLVLKHVSSDDVLGIIKAALDDGYDYHRISGLNK